MPPVGFERTASVGERPQTYALDRAVTGTGPVYRNFRTSLRDGLQNTIFGVYCERSVEPSVLLVVMHAIRNKRLRCRIRQFCM
jgi:hypothetical protein